MNKKKIINGLGLALCCFGGIACAIKFYNTHELYYGIWMLLFGISEFHFVSN